MPGVELSSLEDRYLSSAESLTDDANSQTGDPRRSGRGARPTRNKASLLSKEAAGARAKAEVGTKRRGRKGEGCDDGKGRKIRKPIPDYSIVADIATQYSLLAADLSAKFSDLTESSILPLGTDMQAADDAGYSIYTDIGQLDTVIYDEVAAEKLRKIDLYRDQPARLDTAACPRRDDLPSTQDIWLGSCPPSPASTGWPFFTCGASEMGVTQFHL